MDTLPGIRPRPSLARRLDRAARRGFPTATTVLLLLLGDAPLGLPGQAELRAALAVSAVFFWSLFRPASMPSPAVLAIGLLGDLLGQWPVGVGGLSLLAAHGAAARLRRPLLRHGLPVVWLAFLATAAGVAGLGWALTSLLTLRLLSPAPGLFQAALSAGLFPPLALLLTRAHRGVAEPERA